MKNKINQIVALFVICLIITSPVSLAQGEPQNQPEEFPAADQEFQEENAFNNNPTPENFNKLPNPTAADLERVQNPTLENFNRLAPSEQGKYLSNENEYKREFADQYYSNPANWGANNLADQVFFRQEAGLRDFLKKGSAEKDAAQQYFTKTFGAPYHFNNIADDFFFDSEKGLLRNGAANLVLADFKNDPSVTGITSTEKGFEIFRKINEKEQKVSVAGTEAKTVSYDREKGSFIFLLPKGQQQFDIPEDAQVTFTFDAEKLTINGPASGIINTLGDPLRDNILGDYAQFVNRGGILVISYNGDIDAEDAEVITSRLFMDGRYSKRGNKIEAWDVGRNGKQTVVVDKNACPEAGACIGVSTQGQWDARYLPDNLKREASTLKINLDEISSASSFYADPDKPQPAGEEKAKQLREQAQQLRRPGQPPLTGKNAEVWINKDAETQAITVTSKGIVEVGLYDARGNSAKQLKDKFEYKGLNGLSELDAQFSARTQTNVRGRAEFRNDQFKEGILTAQDGAAIKINHDNFRPDQADVVRAECIECIKGEAIVIHKSVTVAAETEVKGIFEVKGIVKGIFAGAERADVKLTIDIDEKGQIIFTPDKQNLGFLAGQVQKDGREVSIGNNFLISSPCGEMECNFKLSRDPRTGELGAAHEFVDPENPEVPLKRTEYPLTIGKVLGSEAILVSEHNADEVNKLTALIEEGKFNELSKLSFDKDDAGFAALKKKFLQESGLNLDAVADPKYAKDIEIITKTTRQAKETFSKYGIELDVFGNPKTRGDAEKYQKIVNKGLGVDTDELTRAKWDLTRMRVREVESLIAACQGTAYCSVNEKDLKAAKEEEKTILNTRTANYNRWKTLVQRAELEKQLKEAEERAKREDKGIDATDKKELEDAKRKIDVGNKRKFDLEQTFKSQVSRADESRAAILSKLKQEWLVGSGKKAVFEAIDLDRFNSDPNYVVSLINQYAPRYFLTDELESEVYNLRENFKADANLARETQKKIVQQDNDLKAWESQNQALIEKYRLEGKDDVAAEVALRAGNYEQVINIITGPSIAAENGIKEVVRLETDTEGNAVVVERTDVSVLAGRNVVPETVAKDITDRAVRQQREETLDQAALYYDYGFGAEASAILQGVETENPQLAQELDDVKKDPEARLRPELVKLQKARLAQADYAERVLIQRQRDLENTNYQARLKAEEENLGAGREMARAWEGFNADVTSRAGLAGTIEGAARLAEASFGFVFDSSEKAAADALGITDIREGLDEQAFREQSRQLAQLNKMLNKVEEYNEKGISSAQAFADARGGLERGADGKIISSSAELQISVADEPAAAILEFDLTAQVFSEQDKEFLKTIDNPLERQAFITKRQEEYEQNRKELEFDLAVRDAENAERFNRGKLSGEPAAKFKEALVVCPECAGAKAVQDHVETLDENVLGDIIAVYTGEAVGRSVAGGLEKVGVAYTRETEEEFRDMAIASFDALAVFDVAEAVIGAPLALLDAAQKLRKISKTVDAAGTALDAYRYASKSSREVFAAAKAAERSADTVEAAAEARKAVDIAKAALDAEIKSGLQASKYQKFKRALDTPLGKFDRDLAKARNFEIENIAAQTQNLNQAQRELEAAKTSGDVLAEGQSLVKVSQSREALQQSAKNIDALDDLQRVSKIAGPKSGMVRTAWDAAFGKVFGSSAGDEIISAERNFRKAADDFADAGSKARLVGDTPEAVISRARLDAAKESLEIAAEKLDDAYLNRKSEKSKSVIRERLQQAQVSGKGDNVFDAVGAEGAAKLDAVMENPAVRLEPKGTGLKLIADESASLPVIQEVEEANILVTKIDEVTSATAEGALTAEARVQGEAELFLLEDLATGEHIVANDVKARRLEAAGAEIPVPERLEVSEAVDPCVLAAAAIYGLAPCQRGAAAEVFKEAEEILPPREIVPEVPPERIFEVRTRTTAETPSKWKEAINDPEQFAEIRQKAAAEKTKTIQIGEAEDFTFIDGSGNLVEGSQTLYYDELEDVPAFTLEITDLKTGKKIASHDYYIITDPKRGEIISVGLTVVDVPYRQAGVNQRLFQQMLSLHPNVKYIDTNLADENKRLYAEALLAGDIPLEAIRKTPAYKVREAAGWEIDLQESILPELEELEVRPLQLISKRETPEDLVIGEVASIKKEYAQQRINVEAIRNKHPLIEVNKAEADFAGKIGEGTTAVVFEGNLPDVGENLVFKTAKTQPGELPLRGNLQGNIDGLFREMENAQEACKLVPCPRYYGMYEIDGIPYLVSEKIEGKRLFDLSIDEMLQYDIDQKLENFNRQLGKAAQEGWIADDVQGMVLTEPQVISGVQYQEGDIIVIDLADWRLENRGTSSIVNGCAIASGAIHGSAASGCPLQVKMPVKMSSPSEITSEVITSVPSVQIKNIQIQNIFISETVKLAEKTPEELPGAFYNIYHRKTAPSVIEEGAVNHGLTSVNLYEKIGLKNVEIDPSSIQGGWIGIRSSEDLPFGNKVRYYINSRNSDASLAVVEEVAKKLSDQNIPFAIKSHPDKAAFARRTDNTVLYIDASNREQVEKVVSDLDPALFDDEVPLFTQKISKGISWGEEPGNAFYKGYTPQQIEYFKTKGITAPSFGQKRSEALAEIYTAADGKIGPEFDNVIREIFKKHGIDPDEPWLNFDSSLKEISAPREPGMSAVSVPAAEKIPSAEVPVPIEVLEQQSASSVKYLGNGVFEYGGKNYVYDAGTNTWKQQRKLLWDKKVTDEDITAILYDDWSRRLDEGTLSTSEAGLKPCALAGKAIVGFAPCTIAGEVEKLSPETLSPETPRPKTTAPGLEELAEQPAPEISGVRIKEPKFFESEPLSLEQKIIETPPQILDEIAAIKRGYAQRNIDLETIIQNHPSVKVEDAEIVFTDKLGEGTVGLVYEADLPGVGDNLAFKTAKAAPGEKRVLRGTLESNVDGLFAEFEKVRSVCALVPCPAYYGIYKVDGIPYLVSDKIEGRHFFDLTDEEVIQYFTLEKQKIFEQDLAKAIDAGWDPLDLQAMVLNKPQMINGKQYQKGDIIFVDVAEWNLFERTAVQKQDLLQAWIDTAMIAPRNDAENALEFKRDLTPAAEILQEASPEELKIALDAAGFKLTEDVFASLLPVDKKLRRMYERDIDPLLVSQKIPEAKTAQFKNKFPRSAEAVENADVTELERAIVEAGYQTSPDKINIIRNKDTRLQQMNLLGMDPGKVAKAIPGTHAEQIFEISAGKFAFNARKGKWVQLREEGLAVRIFGDKEISDEVTLAELNQAREKAGLPKVQPAVIQKRDNLFERTGKEYYFEDGVWKQKRTLWFDREVDDAEVIGQLDETKSRLIEEGLLTLPETKLESCSVGGRAIIGGAIAGPCLPANLPSQEIVFNLPPRELPEPQVVATVQGYEGTVSNLYDSIAPENAEEVFQNQLEFLGENIYGGKAVAYIHDDGRVQVVFLTESDKTHHRQALGRIIGGEKGELVYNGQYDNYLIADLPNRAFGFEFQYDKSRGKIIGMQAGSQITNIQKAKGTAGWKLPEGTVEYVEQEMLEKIDLDLIDESLADKPLNQWIDSSRIPVSSSS